MKRLYYDLETTGLNPAKHGIHQMAGMVVINGELKDRFNIKMQPNPKAQYDPEALKVANLTKEQILQYQPFEAGYKEFMGIIEKHVDRFNKKDKFHLVGYNNRAFDDNFLRGLLRQNGNEYFGSYFWSDSIDVLVLSSYFLEARRVELPNFKLSTVAAHMGITVEESKLHEAGYDIDLTHLIMDKITATFNSKMEQTA